MTGPSFLDIVLPPRLLFGYEAATAYDDDIIAFESGLEQRNLNRENGLGEWQTAALNVEAQIRALYVFFRQARGRVWGWRLHDWLDHDLTDEPIGTADATAKTFSVIKTYGTLNPETRRIFKLANAAMSVAGAVTYTDPVIKIAGTVRSSGVTVDVNAGTVALAVGLPTGTVTISGQFHAAARFDVQKLPIKIIDKGVWSCASIPIVEIDPTES